MKYQSFDSFLHSIGSNIRYYRKELGLSIEQLAEALNMSPSFIGQMERGKRQPSYLTLYKLAQLFKIEPYQLISCREEPECVAENNQMERIQRGVQHALNESISHYFNLMKNDYTKSE